MAILRTTTIGLLAVLSLGATDLRAQVGDRSGSPATGLPRGSTAPPPDKRPLDHPVYEQWDTLGAMSLSPNGRWALYTRFRYDRDDELRIHATAAETAYGVSRGSGARFDADSRFLVFLIRPLRDSISQARRERRPAERMPRDSLGIMDLRSGEVVRVGDVKSFALPEESARWLAYHLEPERAPEGADTATAGAEPAGAARQATARGRDRRKPKGTALVLRELATGEERRFENVVSYGFSQDGARLAYAASTTDGAGDGVFVVEPASGEAVAVLTGEGEYRRLAWDEVGRQLAFVSNRDAYGEERPPYTLYHWQAGRAEARPVAGAGSADRPGRSAGPGIPAGWSVSENGSVTFSRNGRRLFFGTAPAPDPDPADDRPAEERVGVEIWHWQDPLIQTMQQRRLEQEGRRTYLAVVHLRDGRVAQLADEGVPDVATGARGDADVALGTSSLPYARVVTWDFPAYADHYLVDVRTGARERFRERAQGGASLSPDARYAFWYDPEDRGWHALDVRTRRATALTAGLPYPVHNEDHDAPSNPSAYGSGGWIRGDSVVLLYDRFDVWAVDPAGRASPRNSTAGVGRRDTLRFRVVRLDREADAIDPAKPLLLSAFHLRSKMAGFYRMADRLARPPERLVLSDHAFSRPIRAENADVLLFTRSNFREFPDLRASGTDFGDARTITAENPWQDEYRWGTVELVEWTSGDGVPLQGILYKPDDFDPSRRYPMIVYFYERMSDALHMHYPPVPHRSRINITFYTSRGYLVFVPDVRYRIGYPGESALHSIVPGTLAIVGRGFVDEDRIALQGHSWAGYQIAYIVTRTDLFRAAAPGAPVANMTSAYSGIRRETGMARQFQYERTQSRIGGSLWEMPAHYVENSPLLRLDRVNTPLLIMHNDMDGAVPWEQGLELFLGLRRLERPAWLVNYPGEPHWPTTYANKRDWNIRMQQFFDHYLLGAPAPVWLADGIPAIRQGRTLGYELAEPEREPPVTATDPNTR